MERRFCDICDSPAIDRMQLKQIEMLEAVGEPYQRRETTNSEPVEARCKIVVSAHFSFRDHQAGFSGPPDLCAKCVGDLLAKLARQFQRVG